jgi:hypothetical protein
VRGPAPALAQVKAMAEGEWTPYAVVVIAPSSAAAIDLVAGVWSVYTDGRRVEAEAEGTKAAIVLGSRRSHPPLALPLVGRSRLAFPHRDEENLRLGQCARCVRRSVSLV